MLKARIPENEAPRLAALKALNVLDTPPEERFDRITRIATRLFDVPMAYVSMIDANRQWFKSACGISGPRETPRDISFCGHAIHGENALVIPDALKDSRFADSPLVTGEMGVRFYAGQPLKGPDGHKVGTFCIADRKPRQMSEADLKNLRELAGIVERELNLTDVIRLQNDLLVAQEKANEAEKRRADALKQLLVSQKKLTRELEDAAAYVRSLLPAPMRGAVTADWCFHPCSQLGGDALGYRWLDDDHLAIYLLDVCGHGVSSALLSISAINALRSDALPETDFHDPSQVLTALNHAFPMDQQDNKYFTIWYGVLNQKQRKLKYAAGGHPPALLMERSNGSAKTKELWTENFFIGLDPKTKYHSETVQLDGPARLYVFSDGAFEITRPEGGVMHMSELEGVLRDAAGNGHDELQAALSHAERVAGSTTLPDDFSLMRLKL